MLNKESNKNNLGERELKARLDHLGSGHEWRWIEQFVRTHPEADPVQIIRRRESQEPLQYIFGTWPFCGVEFELGPGVLIPRPETEELAFMAVAWAEQVIDQYKFFRIADLGAGTGCLGLSVVRELTRRGVTTPIELDLVEREGPAFEYLLRNYDRLRKELGSSVRVSIQKADFCEFDLPTHLILSNPPYLTEQEWDQIDLSVKEFEPRSALVPDDIATFPDASGPYRKLLAIVDRVLRPGGRFYFEIGASQQLFFEQWKHLRFQHRLKTDLCSKLRFVEGESLG